MSYSTFEKFSSVIRSYGGNPLAADLLLAQDGPLSSYYAPFEWVNPQARVVLVGITPGKTQAANALAEAKRALLQGASTEEVLRRAKSTGAFSGAMRPNLIALLDAVGLNAWLGLASCGELFGKSSALLQTASVLQFPVFMSGENYNGSPDPIKHPFLRAQVREHFEQLCSRLPSAVFVPLGPVPSKVLACLALQGVVAPEKVLAGLPHPSGANAERIKYFLGQKDRASLSSKTDPAKLDSARQQLRRVIAALQ